jgi:hypothetical protein
LFPREREALCLLNLLMQTRPQLLLQLELQMRYLPAGASPTGRSRSTTLKPPGLLAGRQKGV